MPHAQFSGASYVWRKPQGVHLTFWRCVIVGFPDNERHTDGKPQNYAPATHRQFPIPNLKSKIQNLKSHCPMPHSPRTPNRRERTPVVRMRQGLIVQLR